MRLPVHSLTSRGHSHGHSHSFCSILRKKKPEQFILKVFPQTAFGNISVEKNVQKYNKFWFYTSNIWLVELPLNIKWAVIISYYSITSDLSIGETQTETPLSGWKKKNLWQLRHSRSTVLQAQNARESHVSLTMPAKALVPGIRVRRYLEQWLPWTRLVRSPLERNIWSQLNMMNTFKLWNKTCDFKMTFLLFKEWCRQNTLLLDFTISEFKQQRREWVIFCNLQQLQCPQGGSVSPLKSHLFFFTRLWKVPEDGQKSGKLSPLCWC